MNLSPHGGNDAEKNVPRMMRRGGDQLASHNSCCLQLRYRLLPGNCHVDGLLRDHGHGMPVVLACLAVNDQHETDFVVRFGRLGRVCICRWVDQSHAEWMKPGVGRIDQSHAEWMKPVVGLLKAWKDGRAERRS
jgi:hypothetical protein